MGALFSGTNQRPLLLLRQGLIKKRDNDPFAAQKLLHPGFQKASSNVARAFNQIANKKTELGVAHDTATIRHGPCSKRV